MKNQSKYIIKESLVFPEWVDNALDYLDNKFQTDTFEVNGQHHNAGVNNVIYELGNNDWEFYLYYNIEHWNKAVLSYVGWMQRWYLKNDLKNKNVNLVDYLYKDNEGTFRFNLNKIKKNLIFTDRVFKSFVGINEDISARIILDNSVLSEIFYQNDKNDRVIYF